MAQLQLHPYLSPTHISQKIQHNTTRLHGCTLTTHGYCWLAGWLAGCSAALHHLQPQRARHSPCSCTGTEDRRQRGVALHAAKAAALPPAAQWPPTSGSCGHLMCFAESFVCVRSAPHSFSSWTVLMKFSKLGLHGNTAQKQHSNISTNRRASQATNNPSTACCDAPSNHSKRHRLTCSHLTCLHLRVPTSSVTTCGNRSCPTTRKTLIKNLSSNP